MDLTHDENTEAKRIAERYEKIRRVIFTPYCKGMGPRFELVIYATPNTDWRGQTKLAYTLRAFGGDYIFAAADFAGSPMHADDSDSTVASLMSFLTTREGDTDATYFDDYTELQTAFRDEHADNVHSEVWARFRQE